MLQLCATVRVSRPFFTANSLSRAVEILTGIPHLETFATMPPGDLLNISSEHFPRRPSSPIQTPGGGGVRADAISCPQARTSRSAAKAKAKLLWLVTWSGDFRRGALSLEGKQKVKHFDACESAVRRGCRVRRAEGRLAVLDLGGGGINFPTPAAEACRGAFR